MLKQAYTQKKNETKKRKKCIQQKKHQNVKKQMK